jgi:hypothetical protein
MNSSLPNASSILIALLMTRLGPNCIFLPSAKTTFSAAL